LEIQSLINIGQFRMSVGIAGNVVKVNRMTDGCQRRSTLQPTVAVAIGIEIDALQVYDANGKDLPSSFWHTFVQVRILDILDPSREILIPDAPARRRSGAEIG